MANLTNVHGLPDAFVNAIKNDPYTGGGDISVTKLIDSPRRRVLGKKFKDLVVVDVSEMTWALMGQCMHTVLERADRRPGRATSLRGHGRLARERTVRSLSRRERTDAGLEGLLSMEGRRR